MYCMWRTSCTTCETEYQATTERKDGDWSAEALLCRDRQSLRSQPRQLATLFLILQGSPARPADAEMTPPVTWQTLDESRVCGTSRLLILFYCVKSSKEMRHENRCFIDSPSHPNCTNVYSTWVWSMREVLYSFRPLASRTSASFHILLCSDSGVPVRLSPIGHNSIVHTFANNGEALASGFTRKIWIQTIDQYFVEVVSFSIWNGHRLLKFKLELNHRIAYIVIFRISSWKRVIYPHITEQMTVANKACVHR